MASAHSHPRGPSFRDMAEAMGRAHLIRPDPAKQPDGGRETVQEPAAGSERPPRMPPGDPSLEAGSTHAMHELERQRTRCHNQSHPKGGPRWERRTSARARTGTRSAG